MSDTSRFNELGFDPRYLTPEQRAVIEELTDDEVALLQRIKSRLDSAGDVEGHNMDGGGVLW